MPGRRRSPDSQRGGVGYRHLRAPAHCQPTTGRRGIDMQPLSKRPDKLEQAMGIRQKPLIVFAQTPGLLARKIATLRMPSTTRLAARGQHGPDVPILGVSSRG
jgi:hypothetical protein